VVVWDKNVRQADSLSMRPVAAAKIQGSRIQECFDRAGGW